MHVFLLERLMGSTMTPAYIIREEQHKRFAVKAIEDIEPSPKKPHAVYVGEWKETRTQKQNRYLWGWVYSNIARLLNESGQIIQRKDGAEMEWTDKLLHVAFAMYRELPPIETINGEIVMHESTAEMSKQRFSKYVEDIKRACWGWFNITIPEPVGIWVDYYNDIMVAQ